jgi:hypothetical protein
MSAHQQENRSHSGGGFDTTTKSKPAVGSKWRSRRKLKPVLKTLSITSEDQKDFFSQRSYVDEIEDLEELPDTKSDLKLEQPPTKRLRSRSPVAVHEETLSDIEIVEQSSIPAAVIVKTDVVSSSSDNNPIVLDDDDDDTPVMRSSERKKDAVHIDEDEEELDPELAARIRKRHAELTTQIFPVDVIVEAKMEELKGLGRIQFSLQSNMPFSTLRQMYIKRVSRILNTQDTWVRFIVSPAIAVYKDIQVFDVSTPASFKITKLLHSMSITFMDESDFIKMKETQRDTFLKDSTPAKDDILQSLDDESQIDGDAAVAQEEEEHKYFRIKMAGKDHEPLVVQVSPETKIAKLAEYYKQKRNLPVTAKVELEFDDDRITACDCVADTELDEDFTVDVYVRL